MAIHFRCPTCGSKIRVKVRFAGRSANCPACGDAIRIPTPPRSGPQSDEAKDSPPDAGAHHDEIAPEIVIESFLESIRPGGRWFTRALLASSLFLATSMFLCCGGCGLIRSLIGIDQSELPTKAQYDEPVKEHEMIRRLEKEKN
jgi:hypothetical protein